MSRYHGGMNLRRRTLVLGSLLALASSQAVPQAAAPAAPAATSYNVEIIVFRNSGNPAEDWSGGGARAPQGGPGDEAGGGGAQVGRLVGTLPSAQFQLAADHTRLQAAGYTVLTHLAWTQTASSWGSRAGFTLARLGSTAAGLGGLVYLERGSYLHLGMSLRFSGSGPSYELTEMRRVKFYDKHYFDHPGFGVIALVTPTQGARPPGR